MDGHGVGRLQLAEQVERIFRPLVVEVDRDQLRLIVDLDDHADVAVENARPGAEAVWILP